jgi:hypothetical protein
MAIWMQPPAGWSWWQMQRRPSPANLKKNAHRKVDVTIVDVRVLFTHQERIRLRLRKA